MSQELDLPARFHKLAEAEARMTEGGWRYEKEPPGTSAMGYIVAGSDDEIAMLYSDGTDDDGEGIALARNELSPLLEEVSRLRKAMKSVEIESADDDWADHRQLLRNVNRMTREALAEPRQEKSDAT